MKYLLLIFVFFLFGGCSAKLTNSFSGLSKPEKNWVIFHPFKAKKAFLTTKSVESDVDSVAKYGAIGVDNNGGHLDAFKHSFWMARLTQGIGKKAANSLGRAHEKGNYKTYKGNRLEDGLLPDKPSSEMDLYNNGVGIKVGHKFKESDKLLLMDVLLDSLSFGKLRILRKDSLGNFVDCKGKVIIQDSLRKWSTKKCLVPSNYYTP